MSDMAIPYKHDDALLLVKMCFNNCNYDKLTPEASNERLNETLRYIRFKCIREVKNTFVEPLMSMDYEGKKKAILAALEQH